MDIKQARDKLIGISGFTHNKHHKVLIGELCEIIKFLLDEIDRIKTPTISVLKQNFDLDPNKPIYTPPPSIEHNPTIPCQSPWPNKPESNIPRKSPQINTPHPYRK